MQPSVGDEEPRLDHRRGCFRRRTRAFPVVDAKFHRCGRGPLTLFASGLQLEHVPRERPALVVGEVVERSHRAARNAFPERGEDLGDGRALLELVGAELARSGIEVPGRGAVARAGLSVARDAPDGVRPLPLSEQLQRPLRRLGPRARRIRPRRAGEAARALSSLAWNGALRKWRADRPRRRQVRRPVARQVRDHRFDLFVGRGRSELAHLLG